MVQVPKEAYTYALKSSKFRQIIGNYNILNASLAPRHLVERHSTESQQLQSPLVQETPGFVLLA
jgi:hypothetical protein